MAVEHITLDKDIREFLRQLVRQLNENFDHLDGQGANIVRKFQDLDERLVELLETVNEDNVPEHDHSDDDEGASLDAYALEAEAVMDGDAAGGDLGGTYPNPTVTDDSHAHTDATAPGTAHPDLATHDTLGLATQTELDAHTGDTTDAHDASAISFAPAGTIAATDVQAAIEEVAAEAGGGGSDGSDHDVLDHADANTSPAPSDGDVLTWDATPGEWVAAAAGVGAHPDLATHDALGLATDAELAAHLADAADAHDASAVSVDPTGLDVITGDDVQEALGELDAAVDSQLSIIETADFLVGSAQGGMVGEIVVGTTPGGELGGTWASPTVDPTHAGSTHSEAADAHIADATDAHDASAISIADAGGDFTATDVEGALAELQADAEADATDLANHLADAADAHDASAISIADAGGHFTGTDVEAALQELGGAGGGAHPDLAAHDTLGLATQAELDGHTGDTSDAHDASAISYGGNAGLAATDVEGALDELDNEKADSTHTHQAFPVGSIFIGAVSTNPATLLGYGTWAAFGAGRVLVGQDGTQAEYDTAEETGGAETSTPSAHAGTAVAAHAAHEHAISTTGTRQTGGSVFLSTVTNNDRDADGAGTTWRSHSVTQPSAHDAMSVVQPYIVVYMWKRTA